MGFWGDLVDNIGTALNLPEFGMSEHIAGGNKTSNTGRIKYSANAAPWLGTSGVNSGDGYTTSEESWLKAMGSAPTVNTSSPTSQTPTKTANNDELSGNLDENGIYSGNYYGGSGGARGGSAASYNPADIAYLDDQMARLQRQHGSADTALNNGLTQLQDSYGREVQGATTRQNQAMQDFTTKETDTIRAKDSALTRTNENARTLAEGLRRRLGLASGSGSSAFQFAAPGAVAKMATENRTGVLENFGTNFRDLNTARDRTKTQFEQMLEDLAAQKKTRESDFRSGILEKKSTIDGSLAEVARQKALALGGGYTQAKAAMAPFVSQIDSRQAEIDGLFNKFRTPFVQKAVDTSMPTLRDYMVDRANIKAGQPGPQDPTAPYKNPFGIKKEEDQPVALY